jgi:hypothetical protein
LDGSGHGLINVSFWYYPEGTEENYENPVRIASVLVDVHTKYLLNTRPEY